MGNCICGLAACDVAVRLSHRGNNSNKECAENPAKTFLCSPVYRYHRRGKKAFTKHHKHTATSQTGSPQK